MKGRLQIMKKSILLQTLIQLIERAASDQI